MNQPDDPQTVSIDAATVRRTRCDADASGDDTLGGQATIVVDSSQVLRAQLETGTDAAQAHDTYRGLMRLGWLCVLAIDLILAVLTAHTGEHFIWIIVAILAVFAGVMLLIDKERGPLPRSGAPMA